MKPVRLGFIGTGYIATRAHLPALQPLVESGDVVHQAFCDIDADAVQERAAEFGARTTYTDYRQMLDREELDAVYVCLPPTVHSDEVTLVAEKGLHLFVEKPVSLDMAKARAFAVAIEKAGIVSQVGFNYRYHASSEPARQLVHERTPRHAQIQRFYSGAPIRWWTSRYEECGGSFVENTIHSVDLLRYFLGDITDVSAFYVWRKAGEGPEPMNLPHAYTANYRFASGAIANATISRVLTNVSVNRSEMIIVSDDSLIEWSPDKVIENGETVFAEEPTSNCQMNQARGFIGAVQAEDPAAVRSPYGPSLNSLASVLGANASAERDGERLRLDQVMSGEVTWNPRVVVGQGVPALEA